MKKIRDIEAIARMCRHSGRLTVLAHGVFDILHVGHIRYLEQAKEMGAVLIVTVTSDRHVNKGPDRPFFRQGERAEALAALSCVDFAAINDEPNAVKAIKAIRPAVYVKGPECETRKTTGLLLEQEAIESVGGRMAYTSGEIFSSTEIGRKVLAVS